MNQIFSLKDKNELKDNQFLDRRHISDNELKHRSVRGGLATVLGQGITFALQMGSTIILARLLTPNDFGMLAMVTALVGFIALFKDLGLSTAVIQRKEIKHSEISTLFWVNVAFGLLVMIVVALIAPLIAWFYGEPKLVKITLVIAIAFVVSGLSVQHSSLLRRQMRFAALSLVEICSTSMSVIIGMVFALFGGGYWSLVAMRLAYASFYTAIVWVVCRWRPGSPVIQPNVISMLKFGGYLTSFSLVNYLSRNVDNILIGWRWGAGSLGLYSKAYGLLLLPLRQINAPVSSITISVLSRLQDEPARYKNYYLKALALIAFVTMPITTFLVLMSEEVIRIVLGEQWLGASRIFAILGISALIQPILNTNGWLHVSIGRTDRMLKWGMFSSFFTIISFLVGLPFGPEGVAVCYTVVSYLLASVCLWYAAKPTPVNLKLIWMTLQTTILATLSVAIVLSIFKSLYPILFSGFKGLGLGFLLTIIVFLITSCILARSFRPISQIQDLISVLIS